MSWVIKSTDDIELAIVEWQKVHPEAQTIIGRTEDGVWWNDELGSTHLTKWDEIREYIQ